MRTPQADELWTVTEEMSGVGWLRVSLRHKEGVDPKRYGLDNVSRNVANDVVREEQNLREIEATLRNHEPCLIDVEADVMLRNHNR
jgi:hypothetical protein